MKTKIDAQLLRDWIRAEIEYGVYSSRPDLYETTVEERKKADILFEKIKQILKHD
jgi:hypothetical protein